MFLKLLIENNNKLETIQKYHFETAELFYKFIIYVDALETSIYEEFVAVDGEKFRYCINELYMEGEWPSNSSKVVMPYSLFDRNNIYGVENGRRDQEGRQHPRFRGWQDQRHPLRC